MCLRRGSDEGNSKDNKHTNQNKKQTQTRQPQQASILAHRSPQTRCGRGTGPLSRRVDRRIVSARCPLRVRQKKMCAIPLPTPMPHALSPDPAAPRRHSDVRTALQRASARYSELRLAPHDPHPSRTRARGPEPRARSPGPGARSPGPRPGARGPFQNQFPKVQYHLTFFQSYFQYHRSKNPISKSPISTLTL